MRHDADASHDGESLARPIFIAVLAFIAFWSTLRTPVATDANDHVYLADAFVRSGSVDLTSYRAIAAPYVFHGFEASGRAYSAYTSGAALLFVPFAALAAALGLEPGSFAVAAILTKIAAALSVSLAVACVYLVLRALVSEAPALLITFASAFGTGALSVASQVYFQHGPSLALLSLALLALVRGGQRGAALAGLALGAAIIVRPQNALLALAAAAFVLHRKREIAPRFALWAVAPLLFQAAYGLAVNGNPLPVPASTQRPGDLLDGLPGLIVSPSRGLLIGSPFLVLALAAFAASWRWRSDDLSWLLRYASLGVVATVVLFAAIGEWWGGHAYGNRYLLDPLPFYALALGAAWARGWLRPRALHWAFLATLAWSVVFHAAGAAAYYTPEGWRWEQIPEINDHPARLWSWADAQWQAVFRAAATSSAPVALAHATVLAATAAAFAWLARAKPTT